MHVLVNENVMNTLTRFSFRTAMFFIIISFIHNIITKMANYYFN